MKFASVFLLLTLSVVSASITNAQDVGVTPDAQNGYFRYPAIHGNTIIFTAEGDLWKVSADGGIAQRLTTDYGQELYASISPDGSTVAFTGSPQGASEVYTMPVDGGLPAQRTFDGGRTRVVGWTHDGDILFATPRYSTLPDIQMAIIDLPSGEIQRIPLSQAYDGCYDQSNKMFYFTREPYLGSHTKRYRGGAAQNIWKFTPGSEAISLTADYPGISKTPMLWNSRIYFLSDRDGTMNIWSMDEDGGDLSQHTFHAGWDIQSPSLADGRIAYQLGADLHVYDIAAREDRLVPIRLASDFEQTREEWVKKPFDYLTAAHISPDGDRVVLTARGEVFTAPAEQGRTARVTHEDGVRYRQARFMPDGKNLLVLSDKSGEVEFWLAPADGVGNPTQLTDNGKILRFDGLPSPDGKYIAYTDKDYILWIYDIDRKTHTKVFECGEDEITGLAWSPDGKWLAFVAAAKNWFLQIRVYNVRNEKTITLTTDRYDSFSPAWSADGKWIYFLSNRNLVSLVSNPWGARQAEPYFDRQTQIYLLPLIEGLRSPFQPHDELVQDSSKADTGVSGKEKDKKSSDSVAVRIDPANIEDRIIEVPIPPGNYFDLSVTADHMFWLSKETAPNGKKTLVSAKIDNKEHDVDTIFGEVKNYELSADRKKLMIRKDDAVHIIDADGKKPSDAAKSKVKLDDWTFTLDPRLEWRQMFIEAWRLERDYFYDRSMHGVDWPAMLAKYLPLVNRVTDRDELSDLLGQLISELTALHMYVIGGDARRSEEDYPPATLGAVLARDDGAGGYVIDHIYLSDPDRPDERSPLARPGLDISEGDIIVSINGVPTLSVDDASLLLRHEAGKQVLLGIKSPSAEDIRRVVVVPISQRQDADLRYSEWEYTRRQMVDRMSDSAIGYVHLRAMGAADFAQWAREFYPVYLRQGLIVDVRHNNGGSIDSWILERLLRKPWLYWQSRTGNPSYNMQYAFGGHVVVLCDELTYSDGEMFTEGIKRLGIGKVIGARTAGGEIWLSFSNTLVDKGIASAAETGVYGPEGKWVIENHGVEPDISVDNLPSETFDGKDAQLQAAIDYLKEQIRLHPVEMPKPPAYPDKSSPDNR